MTRALLALLSASLLLGAASGPEPELLAAARRGDAARVRALLRGGADPDARNERGFTALMAAAGEGHTDVARLLLRAGADVDASTSSGWTALMEATAQGRTETAAFLIDAGADLEARHRFAGTALDVAQQEGRREMARLLRDRGSRGSGRSPGDNVCVRPWKGEGFCGVVEEVEQTRLRLRLTRVLGCAGGCAPDEDCSAGRAIGGSGGAGVGDVVWVRSWCLTHTRVSQP
jgi:hypothetical protein